MALPSEQLGAVEPKSADPDQHPARLRLRHGPFLERQNLGRSGAFHDDGFHARAHGSLLLSRRGCNECSVTWIERALLLAIKVGVEIGD